MPRLPKKVAPNLSPEMASYLRRQRLSNKMTQAAISERGRRLGVTFDESWVSQWERQGPKEGFIKALAYLDLIDADLDLLSEMARAPVEWPDQAPASVQQAVSLAASLSLEGRLAAALGVALTALRDGDPDDETAVRLNLMVAIIARKGEMLALAAHFARCAEERAGGAKLDPVLAGKLSVELSSVAIEQGSYDEAARHLDEISPDALQQDAFLRACERHARGFLLQECRDSRSAVEKFEEALTLYPGEHGPAVAPCLLALIGLNRAQLGEQHAARRALTGALEMARRSGLPLVQLHVFYHTGRAFSLMGRYPEAIELLTTAESLAGTIGKPLRLFEIRLALLDLAERREDRTLSRLLRRRLLIDRPLLVLPHRQSREFDELFGLS